MARYWGRQHSYMILCTHEPEKVTVQKKLGFSYRQTLKNPSLSISFGYCNNTTKNPKETVINHSWFINNTEANLWQVCKSS